MKSDLTYERLSQGELVLELDSEDQRVLSTLAQDNLAFLSAHPQAPVPPTRRRSISWGWMSSSAAAVLVIVFGWGVFFVPRGEDSRAKGGELSLLVYHKTDTGTELLGSSAVLGQNDEIQLAYFSAKKQYAAILSVDGRGTVTTHLPLHNGQALEINTSQPELLPYSYRLDDAPEFETLYLVTSDQPFAVDRVRPFLRALVTEKTRTLQLPAGFSYTAFRIAKKETTR